MQTSHYVLFFILALTIILRLYELRISKKNFEVRSKKEGMKLYKEKFFFLFVILHSSFLISVPLEVYFFKRMIQSEIFYASILIYIICLFLRFKILSSLKENWNVKLIYDIHSKDSVTTSGLYSFIRHPNYLIVILEIFSISILHNAYITCILFSILNGLILFFRIKKEESILFQNRFYADHFKNKKRFIPYIF